MRNNIMNFCWIFIVGVVAGSLKAVDPTLISTLYIIFGVLFFVSILLAILKSKNILDISSKIPILILFIAFFLLGFTRYNHLNRVHDAHHISNFAEPGWGETTVIMEGVIVDDPDIYESRTVLIVRPETYRPADAPEEETIQIVGDGNIRLTLNRDLPWGQGLNPSWAQFSKSEVFGAKVIVRGILRDPSPMTRPGGFNLKEFWGINGLFGSVGRAEIEFISVDREGQPEKGRVNNRYMDGVTNFALGVKDKMLKVFRQTMPFPESAFLGGVTLALRRGLAGKPSVVNSYYDIYLMDENTTFQELIDCRAIIPDDSRNMEKVLDGFNIRELPADLNQSAKQYAELSRDEFIDVRNELFEQWKINYDPQAEKSDMMITDEFQWAGIGHVLAVSGLHVSIITIMLGAIFSAFKIPKKVYAILIVSSLIIFCIITGARPSTTRAVIMNSIAVLSFTYGGKGLKTSLLFGIAGAAFILLMYNPLIVYQAAFTLSFGAVLSLGLLTGPIEFYLRKLKGLTFWFTVVYILFITYMGVTNWFFFQSITGLTTFTLIYAVGIYILAKVQKDYPVIGTFGFNNVPQWLRGFISAQFAIQVGMMIPLSSFYFGRFPMAGAYANFIAIPLIGVIVQLGMLAGLVGLIPYVGIYVALVLNATNWIFSRAFLYLAWLSTEIFDYPFLSKMSVRQVLFYYIIVVVFIWHMKIISSIKKLFFTLNIFTDDESQRKLKYYIAAAALLLFAIGCIYVNPPHHRTFKVTFFDFAGGSSSLVEFPDKSLWLVDGGLKTYGEYRDPFRRRDDATGFSGLATSLVSKRITKFDGVILTSLEKEHISGLAELLKFFETDKLYDQVTPENVYLGMDKKEFFDAVGDEYLKGRSDAWWASEYYDNYMTLLEIVEKQNIEHIRAQEYDIIYQNEYQDREIKIEFFNPPVERPFRKLKENSVVVKFQYGMNSVMLTGDISNTVINKFKDMSPTDKEFLESSVLVYPNHGALDLGKYSQTSVENAANDVLKIFKPEVVVVQQGNITARVPRNQQRTVRTNTEKTKEVILEKGIKYYSTDEEYTVIMISDGVKFEIDTYKQRAGDVEISADEEELRPIEEEVPAADRIDMEY
jgi:ComEC/Rec2-related protein